MAAPCRLHLAEPVPLRASPLKAPGKEVNFEDVRVTGPLLNQLATLWAPLCLALRLAQAESAPKISRRKTTSARACKTQGSNLVDPLAVAGFSTFDS